MSEKAPPYDLDRTEIHPASPAEKPRFKDAVLNITNAIDDMGDVKTHEELNERKTQILTKIDEAEKLRPNTFTLLYEKFKAKISQKLGVKHTFSPAISSAIELSTLRNEVNQRYKATLELMEKVDQLNDFNNILSIVPEFTQRGVPIAALVLEELDKVRNYGAATFKGEKGVAVTFLPSGREKSLVVKIKGVPGYLAAKLEKLTQDYLMTRNKSSDLEMKKVIEAGYQSVNIPFYIADSLRVTDGKVTEAQREEATVSITSMNGEYVLHAHADAKEILVNGQLLQNPDEHVLVSGDVIKFSNGTESEVRIIDGLPGGKRLFILPTNQRTSAA